MLGEKQVCYLYASHPSPRPHFYQEFLLLQISHIHDLLEKLSEDLRSGRVSLASLAITKQLTKEPDDYADKKSLPHVQVRIFDLSILRNALL